jgi:hypothetical protein
MTKQKLTGVWHGLYTYPGRLGSVSFVATLIEAGNSISGTTYEPRTVGNGPNGTLYATLSGNRGGATVSFVKTYDGAGPEYQDAVDYEGTLNADATEIEGRWTIKGDWSGKFLMIRSSRAPEAVDRKVSEQVR